MPTSSKKGEMSPKPTDRGILRGSTFRSRKYLLWKQPPGDRIKEFYLNILRFFNLFLGLLRDHLGGTTRSVYTDGARPDIPDPDFIFHGPILPQVTAKNIAGLVEEQCRKDPDKLAIKSSWQGVDLTYRALLDTSKAIASALLAHGVRAADRVLVLAGNSVDYVQLFIAVGGIGAIFAVVNPSSTTDEVLAAVDLLDPKAIFIAERIGYRKNHDLLTKLSNQPLRSKLIVFQTEKTGSVFPAVCSWDEFVQETPHSIIAQTKQYWGNINPEEPLCLHFTSGTTGPSKGALLTHRNLINNAFLVGHRLQFSSDDVLACCPPLFHCFGLVCGVLATLTHGATSVLPSEVFNAEASLRAISEYGCTVINGVPTMFQALLDYSQASRYNTSSLRLRTGIIAGSSISKNLLDQLSAEFGLQGLAYAFGMTELSAVSFMTTPSQISLLEERSSVGTLLPHTFAKVVDGDMKPLPPGSPGELLIAGDQVFKEYYRNPKKSKDAVVLDDQGRRWLRTGDIVELSASGYCTVVGREKDMIKRGGENIAPRDIESVLELHSSIHVATVVGIPDPRWGEIVCAFVQRKRAGTDDDRESKLEKDRERLNSGQLKTWLRQRIAPHKMPQHVFWIGEDAGVPEQMPINASGKVFKRELSAIAGALVYTSDN